MLAFLAFAYAENAHACSCLTSASTSERIYNATSILVAQVISTKATADMKDPAGWPGFVARYRLLEVIKSVAPPPAQIYSGTGAGDCGVPLIPTISYVFFVSAEGNVNICSGTRIVIEGLKFSDDYLLHIRSLMDDSARPMPAPLDFDLE